MDADYPAFMTFICARNLITLTSKKIVLHIIASLYWLLIHMCISFHYACIYLIYKQKKEWNSTPQISNQYF